MSTAEMAFRGSAFLATGYGTICTLLQICFNRSIPYRREDCGLQACRFGVIVAVVAALSFRHAGQNVSLLLLETPESDFVACHMVQFKPSYFRGERNVCKLCRMQ
ncbi:hypothetical protein PoB_003184700 [Plakobranchus ocellatus]|uniref:Uncharacterized protein n=1 Tax=Plakobranchus ocellatus TaxID=259542 RepID=A0AAV4AEB3_9GAST|nr:hypothetical protein PoB_003184700 [Plakobranchus ocellatus]